MNFSNSVVGFIGLGKMGLPMAKNLQSAGQSLIIYDVSQQACTSLAGHKGTEVATSISEVANKADLIFTMLPTGEDVAQVCQAADGLFSHARPGTLIVDCSTAHPQLIRSLSDAAAHISLRMLDAPVSGGVVGAVAGTLTFMVGADQVTTDSLRPVLSAMGKKIVSCGAPGHGQVAKICNNLLLGISMIGTCEALSLGARHGMDPAMLTEIIASSTGNNWCVSTNNPWPGVLPDAPSSHGYAHGGSIQTLAKDMGLAVQTASEQHMPLLLGAVAKQLYEMAMNQGLSDLDFSSVIKLYAESK
ncbi:3-hydroxyisobutyrate dehydrogenase [Alcaligenaceae bacterium]|nr:3-hydroxyisobutyrate dehydrogenase [Alcaligenaceae bacterium]